VQGDLRFEPVGALTDHADGLSALRTIVDGAPGTWSRRLAADGARLRPGGGGACAAGATPVCAEVQSWRDLGRDRTRQRRPYQTLILAGAAGSMCLLQ
jgi:release factor glutamine methyltransferase